MHLIANCTARRKRLHGGGRVTVGLMRRRRSRDALLEAWKYSRGYTAMYHLNTEFVSMQ
jgi:hypothetical protein